MATKTCRGCGSTELELIIDLGVQPPSNAFKKRQFALEVSYPLRAVHCRKCWLMQVDTDIEPSKLFGAEYVYFSQNSQSWLDHTQRYVEMIIKRLGLNPENSIVTEIGGNDGHLLQHFAGKVTRAINIEPSASVAAVSQARGVETWVEYYKPQQIQSDLIIANNVLAHVPDLDGFVRALYLSLKPGGTITLEFPHALELLRGVQFDTIYHEHYSYLSLTSLEPILERNGLMAYDVEYLPTHGGSLRLYVARQRRGGGYNIARLMDDEAPLRNIHTYKTFTINAHRCRNQFLDWMFKARGKVLGYGAAAKGNTFLNFCGMGVEDISMVADTTAAKQGLFLPGSCIPVVAERTVLEQQPEHLLVLPWNWSEEIMRRVRQVNPEQRFVTAIPQMAFY